MVEGVVGFLVGIGETSGSDWACTGDGGNTLVGSGQWDETSGGVLLESQDSASLGGSSDAYGNGVVAICGPCPGTGGGSECSLGQHALGVTSGIATGVICSSVDVHGGLEEP